MKRSKYESPLNDAEREFAGEQYGLIRKYLTIRRLPYDDWFDVVVFRFLLSVKRWFALPELHRHSFEIVAFYAMRSAIGHEMSRINRQMDTVSLDDLIPGFEDVTYSMILRDPDADPETILIQEESARIGH